MSSLAQNLTAARKAPHKPEPLELRLSDVERTLSLSERLARIRKQQQAAQAATPVVDPFADLDATAQERLAKKLEGMDLRVRLDYLRGVGQEQTEEDPTERYARELGARQEVAREQAQRLAAFRERQRQAAEERH